MTTTTAQPPRTRITDEKHAPGDRAMKKVWMLENLIFHPRTGEEERAAAERMLDRAIAAVQKQVRAIKKDGGGDGI
ncbi:hypothetical protein ACFW9F_26340 [Streptomyces sp. NPDC059506]|uniref:hypothetical protein n=1 Tax=Streptomyces sp. NPDC059506 TaxID=3347751 RepID=UPI0036898494